MKEDIYNKKLEIFVRSIKEAYSQNTYVKKLCFGNLRNYDLNIDANKEFIQIPVRIHMKNEDFKDNVDNTFLGGQLGEEIVDGEFNYMVSQLKKKKFPVETKAITHDFLLDLLRKIPPDFDPNFLLIP